MPIAKGLRVPLCADSVDSPEIRYHFGQEQMTCIIFSLDDVPGYVGRVTFEGFDAIRCCRGEHMPYGDDWTDSSPRPYPWVWEVEQSDWLQERHKYEVGFYKTPLTDDYVHYLFRFHDEFIELIAKGVWFETIIYEDANEPPINHPLATLSQALPAEHFEVEGISCAVRYNPLPLSERMTQSNLCSQTLFQYFLTLDGTVSPSYAAKLRTIRGRPKTTLMGTLFFPNLVIEDGAGMETRFRVEFARYVSQVADRRRKTGK
jgi:hypothetical protein